MKRLNLFRLLTAVFTVITTLYAQSALAFGQNGHRIVARIAENHLTPEARAEIKKITGTQYLSQLSNWPDEIRSDTSWNHTHPWHYVSIDDHEDIHKPFPRSKKGDILKSLHDFEAQLRDKSLSKEKHWQALAFYIHFVGDIHQPLHVGRRDDRGGNDIKVEFFWDKSYNLHRVWDTGMIEQEHLSFREYASYLDQLSTAEISKLQQASYLDWAAESKSYRSQVYDLGKQKPGRDLPALNYQYRFHNIGLVNQRLTEAGIRLAGKLNAIFGQSR